MMAYTKMYTIFITEKKTLYKFPFSHPIVIVIDIVDGENVKHSTREQSTRSSIYWKRCKTRRGLPQIVST